MSVDDRIWRCPVCPDGGELVCYCQELQSEEMDDDHGEVPEKPCKTAECDFCDWRGEMPAESPRLLRIAAEGLREALDSCKQNEDQDSVTIGILERTLGRIGFPPGRG